MKKSYIKCPYCNVEISVSGSSMHVKNKHPDKYEEFRKNFAEIKKTAVLKESATREPVGPEPPKVEDKKEDTKPEDKHPVHETGDIPVSKPEDKKGGDDRPKEGGLFHGIKKELNEFNKWCDSPEL